MRELIAGLFDTSDFPARWNCGDWSTAHGWTHIVSDFAIAGAYAAIPMVIGYLLLKRRDVPFLPIFWLFVAFILFCGIGHFVEAIIFWHPWYRLSALVKVCTAVVSWATVAALLPVLPKALGIPGLAAINQELHKTNLELQRFAGVVVGREDRIIELKQEVNELLRELGRTDRYLGESPDGPA